MGTTKRADESETLLSSGITHPGSAGGASRFPAERSGKNEQDA